METATPRPITRWVTRGSWLLAIPAAAPLMILARPHNPALVVSCTVVGIGAALSGVARSLCAEHRARDLSTSIESTIASRTTERQRFRRILDSQADGVIIVDEAGTLTWANASAAAMLERSVESMIGVRALGLFGTADAIPLPVLDEALRSPQRQPHLSSHVTLASGRTLRVEATMSDARDDPAINGVVVTVRDVTTREELTERLAEARHQFGVVFEQAPVGVTIADENGVIVRVNAALATMLGYEPDEMVGRSVYDYAHPDDVRSDPDLQRNFRERRVTSYHREAQLAHRNGDKVWASVHTTRVLYDRREYVLRHLADITDRHRAVEQLEHAARHDPLTELPNRRELTEHMASRLGEDRPVYVLFCDVDNFKVINDSLGHSVGDELLRIVGARLRGCVRGSDMVARFGGDEFVIVVSGGDHDSITRLVERVEASVMRPVRLRGNDLYVTASIGIVGTSGGATPEDLLRDADLAMYRAKELGRARAEWFDESTSDQVHRAHHVGNNLRRAIARGQLDVVYQPVVDLQTGVVASVEALVRWPDAPEGIQTADVVRIAEENGLIGDIGTFVMRRAFFDAARWRERLGPEGDVTMTVNASARELARETYAADYLAVLAEVGLTPKQTAIELTETALVADLDRAEVSLNRLAGEGVKLIVDDFGTGHGALVYLRRFPFSALKIDRVFVNGLLEGKNDTAIVDSVIGLARSIGLTAIAEGVENHDQLHRLRAMGCRYGQGYLLGRPMSAAAVETMLSSASILAQLRND